MHIRPTQYTPPPFSYNISQLTRTPSLALMNLIANTVSRWLDRNSADWLNQIMLVVNGIAVVGVVLREARRSTSDPGVGRIDDDQTGVGEKESLVGAGAEQCS